MAAAPPATDTRNQHLDHQAPGPLDTLRSLGSYALYQKAKEHGRSLTAYLDEIHPQHEYKDGLDGFERLMRVARINTQTDKRAGYFADTMESFRRDENTQALFAEWSWRQWRKPGELARQVVLSSDDGGVGTITRPYVDQPTPRTTQFAAAIPLEELVALQTPIDGDTYRAAYLTRAPAQTRLVRVTEAAELPRATITSTERTVGIFKYGRALEVSYEQVRRRRIDKVAFWIQMLSIQNEMDKVAQVMDVAVNGDGNAGTAATNYNLTTLDSSAVAGTLTLKAWLAFKAKFANPYTLTHAFAREADSLQLMLLNLGSANVPLVTVQAAAGFGSLVPINPELRDNVRLGLTADAPANVIVGMDARFAIEHVTETGSDIQEQTRWIERQVNLLTFSETEGFANADVDSVRTLTLSA